MRARFVRHEDPFDSLNIGRVNERRLEAAKRNIKSAVDRYAETWGPIHQKPFESELGQFYYGCLFYSPNNTEYFLGYNDEDRKYTVRMKEEIGSPIVYHKSSLEECFPILEKWIKNFA